MNPQYILGLAVMIIMGWFVFGIIYNLRRGDTVLKWMQQGLPSIGPKTTFRWLGTSVAEMAIISAKKPFRRLDTLLVLKPRDVFWMTITASIQGRDDMIIFRAQLSDAPILDLELADPKCWSGRNALRDVAARGWESKNVNGLTLMAPKGLIDLAERTIGELSASMQALSTRYIRFSLRKTDGRMEIHLPFPDTRATDVKSYFENLRLLAKAVGTR